MLLLRAEQSLDLVLRSATVHLVVVSAISACALAVAVAAAVALVAVGSVHWWRWRLGFDRVQLALVVACLFGPGADVAPGRLPVHLSWWDDHAFLLTGCAAAPLRALIGAVEARDAYTHGHSARVAELAVHLSPAPRPPPGRALRHLEAARGTHFDPRCPDAFLALMADQPRPAALATSTPQCGQR